MLPHVALLKGRKTMADSVSYLPLRNWREEYVKTIYTFNANK